MQTTSELSIAARRGGITTSLAAAFDRYDPSPVLMRWAGHLPYFLLGSKLMLPQKLSIGSAVVITLLYAIFCHFISMWIKKHRRPARGAPLRHAIPVLGTLGLLAIMSVVAPVVSACLSLSAWQAGDGAAVLAGQMFATGPSLLCAWLLLLLPVAAGFYTIQLLTAAAPPRR